MATNGHSAGPGGCAYPLIAQWITGDQSGPQTTAPPSPQASSQSAPTAKLSSLTLEDCVVQAVRRNLGVAVQVFSYREADIALTQAGEKFIPSLSFRATQQDQNSASFSWMDASDVTKTKSLVGSASITQAGPLGGNFSISVSGDKYDTNSRFQTINPRYDGQLSFNLTQPLLKNFGWQTSRRDIIVARNGRDIAENTLKSTLLDTVYTVEQAYWNYVLRIESLKVQRQSLARAEALLDKSRKEIAIGTLAPKEILSSQAEVSMIKADILQVEQLVKDAADTLRALINLPLDKDLTDIVPADTPGFAKREIDLNAELSTALKNRPDLQSSALGIRNRELDYSYAKNQMLPQLDLTAQYWSPGLSGDRILFQDNNPLTGIVLGTVPGGASQALKDAFGFKYNNWSIQLQLTVPLSTIFTRAAQAQAQAALDQQLFMMKQTEQRTYLDVRAAVRSVETSYERVGARKEARELSEQKLEAEELKLKVGLSNNFFVLNYQRDLANARSFELQAIIDYTLSLALLDKVTGVSLEKRNIKILDAAAGAELAK
jgi:outer membrane protein TolC